MNDKNIQRMVRNALAEDVGKGDITTRLTVNTEVRCRVTLVAKSDGVLSGMDVFRAVFQAARAHVERWDAKPDGTAFQEGDVLAEFTANTRAALTGERTALNFLQHLSGVATQTSRFVQAIDGLDAKIYDTRKTLPLYRELEKQAVLDGGGTNHRHGLYDAILIKDNHIQAAGNIEQALALAKSGAGRTMKIEIEVTNLEECAQAVEHGTDVIMLDNMSLEEMKQAVESFKDAPVLFEASGNVSLETVRAIAETGVDIISVGALTHSAPAADISLKIEGL